MILGLHRSEFGLRDIFFKQFTDYPVSVDLEECKSDEHLPALVRVDQSLDIPFILSKAARVFKSLANVDDLAIPGVTFLTNDMAVYLTSPFLFELGNALLL